MQNTSTQLEGLWIDINILKDHNLTLQEKFTLAIIKALDKNNGCYASNKYFAEILQVTPKRASDIIQSLVTKKYITSVVENFYKRTLRIVLEDTNSVEEDQEQKELCPHATPKAQSAAAKKKPMMWRGIDLSTWAEDAIERIKKRFPEVEALLSGSSIDESQPLNFRTNEELDHTYRETATEWIGTTQLQFT